MNVSPKSSPHAKWTHVQGVCLMCYLRLQGQDRGYQRKVLQDHLDALHRLGSVCLMREDFAGVKEYCRQVSTFRLRGERSSPNATYNLFTHRSIQEAGFEPRVFRERQWWRLSFGMCVCGIGHGTGRGGPSLSTGR